MLKRVVRVGANVFCVLYSFASGDSWNESQNGMIETSLPTTNVGIGMTSSMNPTEKLDIKGNTIVRGKNWSAGGNAMVYLGDYNHFIKATWGDGVRIGTYAIADGIVLKEGNGNVGIGIVSPVAKLHVAGTTHLDAGATKLSVGPNGVGVNCTPVANGPKLQINGGIACSYVKIKDWTIEAPDYVFAPEYPLRSISEVEKHIAEKKHLPDVPSAAEMKKEGVDLSEMNMILLKKIEELTLYVIEQNKRIAAIESGNGK